MGKGQKTNHLTRREFVAVGAAGGASLLAGCAPGERGNREFLTNSQARTLAALCDEIVPPDEFPGASQAGAVEYIDRQLVRAFRRHQSLYNQGLDRAARLSMERFGGELGALAPAQRQQIVASLEHDDPEFFALLRDHIMQGYYGAPRHGGNRDGVSWRMLGLPDPPLRGRAQYDLGKEPQR